MRVQLAESTLHEFRDLTATTGGTVIAIVIVIAICFFGWLFYR